MTTLPFPDRRVFHSCPWCGWNFLRSHGTPLIGSNVWQVACERGRACRKNFLILTVVEMIDGTPKIVRRATQKLHATDESHFTRALLALGLNADDIALHVALRRMEYDAAEKVPA